mmetsp:Transcript_14253/g.25744  ORF Transcript_14253/g.25744 Transcript_14253/m.25744 type:complete len:100 (+) Transcript_14253:96-395(+)
MNGLFDPNPSISPRIPDEESEATIADESGGDLDSQSQQQQRNEKEAPTSTSILQNYLLPTTFRHCPKSHLCLKSKNVNTTLKMTFSSDDDELYLRFREG